MAKLETVQKSRTERTCFICGQKIPPGSRLRQIGFFGSGTRYFHDNHPLRPSHTEGNDRKYRLLKAQEDLEDTLARLEACDYAEQTFDQAGTLLTEVEAVVTAFQTAIDEAEGVRDEYREGIDNMEEYFPGSPQIDESQEKVDKIEEWISELENAKSELEELQTTLEGFDANDDGTPEA